MRILVFNCGSSSLKFELLELEPADANPRRVAHGEYEEIGRNSASSLTDEDDHTVRTPTKVDNHADAAMRTIDWLGSSTSRGLSIDAVGHRIVHGGESISAPVLVNDEVMRALEDASRFAPLHNPPAIQTIRAVGQRLAGVPTAVVADTAFHQTIPQHARTYALPRDLARSLGIRRYGFHGIGHAWMLERCAALIGIPAAQLNLITLQLGAGCSATAIRGGRSVDTSMGLTPLEGLMMGTRSGDLDPAIFSYVAAAKKIEPAEFERILNHESGLLGVSGHSSDMRELEQAAANDKDAALAIEMFCYRVKKYIGAYMAALERVDGIVFGGGIGENSASARSQILAGLERIGVVLDSGRNSQARGRETRISADNSHVAVYVIPLDEELFIARATARLVAESNHS